jgi:hypothetical protein
MMVSLNRRHAAAIVLGVSLLTGGLSAQGNSQGRGRGNTGSGGGTDVAVSATVIFRDSDRATFANYFTTHKITAQPLPPGIAKNVARGKPLPPGIAKRALPSGLLVLAPKVDKDVTFGIVGNVVVATRGGVVIDVLAGVFK